MQPASHGSQMFRGSMVPPAFATLFISHTFDGLHMLGLSTGGRLVAIHNTARAVGPSRWTCRGRWPSTTPQRPP